MGPQGAPALQLFGQLLGYAGYHADADAVRQSPAGPIASPDWN
jgi:hypothetical protein